jgi:hypothetical protein
MELVSVTEQTRLQVERAERAAEEARRRNRATRRRQLGLDEDGRSAKQAGLDEDGAAGYCAD